ncbi:MAG: anti-sigma factor family protein [Pirellula sp.]|jgi:hypothetical protein
MNEQNKPFDESLISAYLDGELNDSERLEIEANIQNSPSLQQLVKDISTVRSMVAAANPSVKSTRSFQSAEWSGPITNLSVSANETLTNSPATNSNSNSNRTGLSLGLLASLAAVVLIFITTKWLVDTQPDSGQQIVMDSNAPRSFPPTDSNAQSALQSGSESTTDPVEAQAAPARGRRATMDSLAPSIAPMDAEAMSAPRVAGGRAPLLSTEAKEFLTYLEQKLNSESKTQEASRWRFITGDVGNLNFQAEKPELPQEISAEESEKNIIVGLGQSEDEIILQVTEEDAKAILQLANLDRERSEGFSKEQDLLAIAIPSRQEISQPTDTKIEHDPTEGFSDAPKQKTWTIDFSHQLSSNDASAADKNGTEGKQLATDSGPGNGFGAGMAGLGGGYGSIPNEASGRSPSKVSDSGLFSPKANPMRAANRPDSPSANLPTAPKQSGDQTTQTQQSLKSTNLATEIADARGSDAESQAKEKLMRIRILIKKEPSSSGSNE